LQFNYIIIIVIIKIIVYKMLYCCGVWFSKFRLEVHSTLLTGSLGI
jgi:hypothetical protein